MNRDPSARAPRLAPLCAALASAALAAAAPAARAATQQISYVQHDNSTFTAYLVDWQSNRHRGHAVTQVGMGDGAYVDNAAGQRVLTFDAPIVHDVTSVDCNGELFTQHVALAQLSFQETSGTTRRGSTQVIELGTTTDVGGCTPGLVTPYGSLSDAGVTTDQLLMTARPAITDLVPGARIAGFSETVIASSLDAYLLNADVATVTATGLAFDATGDAIATTTTDGWIVENLAGGARAYTRLSVDTRTGQEVWMVGPWNGSAPTSVWRTLMVRPTTGAGFGGLARASHQWESGLFLGTRTPFYIDLYKDGTGLRRSLDLDAGTESDQAITWHFSGSNIVQDRGAGASQRERTWVPVANYGTRRWVLETEVFTSSGQVVIAPRVNFYVDEGAVAPAAEPR